LLCGTPQQQESRRLEEASDAGGPSDEEIRAWMRREQTPEQIRAQVDFWRTPPPPPPTIEQLARQAGYKRTPLTGDFFRTVPTGNYHCCEFSAPPSGDGGGHFLGRLDKGSWLQALEVRVVLIPGDPRRGKPDPEYGIAIRVKSQFGGAEDGVAWVNVSRNKVPYASLCEQITVLHDGGTHHYVCCMSDLLPLDKYEAHEAVGLNRLEEKWLLGEKLHPRVVAYMPQEDTDQVAELVTGKLLEMDNMILLEMLDDSERLGGRIDDIIVQRRQLAQ